MFPSLRALIGALAMLALVAPSATAASGSAEAPAQLAKQAQCAAAKAAIRAGVARWLEGCGAVNPTLAPEAAARSAIAARAALLGLRADGRDLALVRSDQTQKATHVRFQQTLNGVAVFTGQVVVEYDRAGNVLLINNHTLPNLGIDTNPTVAVAQAADVARAAVPASNNLRSPLRQELVIFPGANLDAPQLAWHFTMFTRQPVADWHVFVSARTGQLITSWDSIFRDSGTGLPYDPNLVQETGDFTIRDNNDADSPDHQVGRIGATLEHLTPGVETIKGSYADTTAPGVTGCDLPYNPGTGTSEDRAYIYTRDQDAFEEVVAYYAIDTTQSWIQSLGIDNANNRSVPIDVHCTSDDNSYYSSDDAALHMGDGGVDDAEDAEVIVHEYGHSMHDNQVPGWGPGVDTEQRAMGEGFGDVLAGMRYIGSGDATWRTGYGYGIAEWDATSYAPVVEAGDGSGCLRWIDGTDEATGDDIGAYLGVPTEEHNDGRYWSATLTCIYEAMGADSQARDDVTEMVVASHFSLTPDLTTNAFEDAVAALFDADQTYLDGVNWQWIGDCALARGLISSRPALPPCASAPFSDVGTGHQFCKEIKWMRDTDVSTGFLDGTYKPGIDVTRQAMAAFMARLANATLTPCTVKPFTDVLTTNQFCPEIQWVKAEGISTGFGDGTFGPTLPVTRAAMSAFMARLAHGTLTPCILPPFPDVPISHTFCQEIKWMKDNGISTGFGDGTYRPGTSVTRQAMSAFLFRVSGLL
jgi:hypothetical protein